MVQSEESFSNSDFSKRSVQGDPVRFRLTLVKNLCSQTINFFHAWLSKVSLTAVCTELKLVEKSF